MTTPYSPTSQSPNDPPKKSRTAWWIVFILAMFLVLCIVGLFIATLAGSPDPKADKAIDLPRITWTTPSYGSWNTSEPATVEPTTEDPESADPMDQVFQAGSYEVGKKSDPKAGTIKPGTFLLTTPDHCYWERVKSFDGEFTSIIANDNVEDEATVRVTVKKTDKGINLDGNCVMGQKGGLK